MDGSAADKTEEDAEKQQTEEQTEGQNQPPQQPQPRGVSEEVLPEQLRGRPEAEVKMILANITTAATNLKQKNDELEKKLAGAETASASEKAEPEDKEELIERLMDDPEAVIAEVVQSKFAGQFQGIQTQVGEAIFDSVSRSIDDFSEYEDDVRTVLKNGNIPHTRENIEGAYTLAVGQRTLDERRQNAAAANNPDIPKKAGNAEEDGVDEIKLSAAEDEARRMMGFNKEDWIEYRDSDHEISVPTGEEE